MGSNKKNNRISTPVYDFVQKYNADSSARFHMPGHKGQGFLGCEGLDITEISGADVLSESLGILGESQQNASMLFRTGATYYSAEGSSLSIKTMLMVARMAWQEKRSSKEQKNLLNQSGTETKRPWILAARNIHRAMVDACALLDLDIEFLPVEQQNGICSILVECKAVKKYLEKCQELPIGVYLTSPDYLGVQSDISGIAQICHEYQLPLLVDNAHGSYLAFLKESQHPIALGADICCDSAHKTLPVLTGGAYLHLSKEAAQRYSVYVPKAFSVFASTSPSYLILQSLDLCNSYLSGEYKEKLEKCIEKIKNIQQKMLKRGIPVMDSEPLKIVLDTGANGYSGYEIAEEMRRSIWENGQRRIHGMECEYADNQYLVLMITPENREEDFLCLEQWIENTILQKKKTPLKQVFAFSKEVPERAMTIRQAVFFASEEIAIDKACGRILAQETISCPPAIPIGISGEVITKEMIEVFRFYGMEKISVVACHE